MALQRETMWFVPVGIAGLLGLAISSILKATNVTNGPVYTTSSWLPVITPLAAKENIPVRFASNWIDTESGGNPCAIGAPGALGPNGLPREQGIGQLYNPDDFIKLKLPLDGFREYCQKGTGVCVRALTAEEMRAQGEALIKLIGSCRSKAESAMRTNGVFWQAGDYWKMVKLAHALPGLVLALGPVRAKLGRAPKDWFEYKMTVMAAKLDPGTERYRKEFPRLFLNAEKTANGVASGGMGNDA